MATRIQPKTRDPEVWIGKTWTVKLRFRNKVTGEYQDITGWKFWLTVKEKLEDLDTAAVVQKTVTSHTDATNGLTMITVTAEETDDFAGKAKLWYDVAYLTADGATGVVLSGKIRAQLPATRART